MRQENSRPRDAEPRASHGLSLKSVRWFFFEANPCGSETSAVAWKKKKKPTRASSK